MTPYEALRQCVEAMKLVDFKDCAESEELWHKLNAAQQVAEEVLKRPEQEPVAYLRFRAAHQWSGSGNHDIEYNEWLETCHAHEIGDDKSPAFPVYSAPVSGMIAAAEYIERKANDYLNEHASTEWDTGAVVFKYGEAGREYHSSLVELAEEIRNAAPIATQPAAASSGDAWISVDQPPEIGTWCNVLVDRETGDFWDRVNKPRFNVVPAQLYDVDVEGGTYWRRWMMSDGGPMGVVNLVTHWQPLPAAPTATKE